MSVKNGIKKPTSRFFSLSMSSGECKIETKDAEINFEQNGPSRHKKSLTEEYSDN